MKKTILTIAIVFVVIFIGGFSAYLILTSPKDNGNFTISDFSEEIQNQQFKIEKVYENVTDYKSASKIAKTAIAEKFDNSKSDIFHWTACDVNYDKENDAYYVRTYPITVLPTFGGAYNVIIKSDGTILAIWGEK